MRSMWRSNAAPSVPASTTRPFASSGFQVPRTAKASRSTSWTRCPCGSTAPRRRSPIASSFATSSGWTLLIEFLAAGAFRGLYTAASAGFGASRGRRVAMAIAKGPSPDLDSLRRQLGDALFEARLAVARTREGILQRLEASRAEGIGFEQAAESLGAGVSSQTLRRWLERWRSFGLVGLVEQHRGAPPDPARAARDPAPAQVQLALGGTVEGAAGARVAPLPRRRGGLPSPLVKWSGSKVAIVAQLISLAPDRFERYHEPFVGGGALFFALPPPRAVPGDRNAELIHVYQIVRAEPQALLAAI